MIAYGTDRRDYEIGSTITAGENYQSKINDAGKKLEAILEENRPMNKPERSKSLFVFESQNEAKRFWTIMSNSKFYEVAFEDSDVLHIGDMAITEEMYKSIADDDVLKLLAEKYWAGEKTESPRIEILVPKATVNRIVSKSEIDRKKAIIERMT